METYKASLPVLDRDFTLIFKGEKYNVSKYLLSMHSLKFRDLLQNLKDDFLEISLQTTVSVFNEFIKAVHGEEFCLTSSNVYDLLKIAQEWKVQVLIENLYKYIEENNLPKDKVSDKPQEINQNLVQILAQNVDNAIKMPSFLHLPFDVILQIFSMPQAKIIDLHNYYQFITQMLDVHGKKATKLVDNIDLKLLPSQDLVELLENPNIDKNYISHKLLPVAKYYVVETAKLEESFSQAETSSSTLQNPDSALKKAVARVKALQDNINDLTDQADDIYKDIQEELTLIKTLLSELDKKTKAEAQKQDADSEKAFTDIKNICDRLERLKQQDLKRSPQRKNSMHGEQPVFKDGLNDEGDLSM